MPVIDPLKELDPILVFALEPRVTPMLQVRSVIDRPIFFLLDLCKREPSEVIPVTMFGI
jgi:hypothetical protein